MSPTGRRASAELERAVASLTAESVDVLLLILTALAGLGVGILSGMFGIGGGTMMIPLLNLVLRQAVLTSTATSLFVIAPTSLVGAFRHLRAGSADGRAALVIGAAGALSCVAGSFVADSLPEIVVLLAAACIILYSAYSVIRGAFAVRPAAAGAVRPAADGGGDAASGGAGAASEGGAGGAGAASEAALIPTSTPPTTTFTPQTDNKRPGLLPCVGLGLFAGLAAGIVGVGGGFIIVPISIAVFGFSLKKASGTSLLAIAIIAVPGVISHALLGHIWYAGGLALMLGSIPGADLGARLVARLPERVARLAFGGLLVLSAAMLFANRVLQG
ncbi:MAG: sulfite exporter TauE/SafE family protein [Coriobacteriales bacterium]|jgi:uncharacterized membrane protein YfcA|nr:sulfite exporter TauE/SafE family protein [Coriobacteriales bacterium]